MNPFYLLVVFSVLISACSQILLKKSADREHQSWISSILNWRVILAYCIFFVAVIFNITAMAHGVMLKDMPALESLSAFFVPSLSFLVLKEKFNSKKLLACIIIFIGLYVFYL